MIRGLTRTQAAGPSSGYRRYGSRHWRPSSLVCVCSAPHEHSPVISYVSLQRDNVYGLDVTTEDGSYVMWWNAALNVFVAEGDTLITLSPTVTHGAFTLGPPTACRSDVVGFTPGGRPTAAVCERIEYVLRHPDFGSLLAVGLRFVDANGEEMKDTVVRRAADVYPLRFMFPNLPHRRIGQFYTTPVNGDWVVAEATTIDPGRNGEDDPAMWLKNKIATIPEPHFEEDDNGNFVQRGAIVFDNGSVAEYVL